MYHLLLSTSWVRTIPLENKLDSCYLFMCFAHIIVSNCSTLEMERNVAGKFTHDLRFCNIFTQNLNNRTNLQPIAFVLDYQLMSKKISFRHIVQNTNRHTNPDLKVSCE